MSEPVQTTPAVQVGQAPAGAGEAAPNVPPAPAAAAPPEAAAPAEKPDLAAEVLKRRESASLAKLMREKRDLDARAAQLTEKAPVLEGIERARQFAAEGDHARAVHAFLETLHGADKAKELLPALYEQLTSDIVGVESNSKLHARYERDVARLRREHEELKQQLAKDRAEQEQFAGQIHTERVAEAVQSINSMLEASKDYPYLLAESDDPTQVVWEILVEAAERGEGPSTPEEAAAMANKHFQPIFEKKRTRYQNLLAPNQGASDSNQPETPASQNGSRKSLINADAAQAPDLKTTPTILDREASIDAAWRLYQEKARQQT